MPSTDTDISLPDQDNDLYEAFVENVDEPELYKKPPSSIVVGELVENLDWSFGEANGGPAPLYLSAPGDKTTTSQSLTELSPGEYYVLKFQVEKMELDDCCAHSLQFLLVEDKVLSGFVCTFPQGMDFLLGGGLYLNNVFHGLDLEFPSYQPGEENTVVIAYDGEEKTVQMMLNGELLANWIIAENLASRKLKVRVTGLQVKICG